MTTIFRLHAKRLFDGNHFLEDQVMIIADSKILSVQSRVDSDSEQSFDHVCHDLVVPGFVDLQVNGGGGVLFNNSPSVENIKTIMKAHAQFGTTAMMPTLITDKVSVMAQAADAIAQAIREKVPGILGVHFEGPHISLAKKGAHSTEFIRAISEQEWQILSRKDLGKIIVTLAPENVSGEDISRMVALGIRVCLGHTNADFNTAQSAVDAGASGFTHLYNAMSPLQGREPGVVGTALLNDHTSCGLIVDGHHVDYASCKLAIKTKPKGKVFLVTDAMPPVGTSDTEFAFFDRTVHLSKGKLTSTTGELAGSVLDMATAVRNAHQQCEVTLCEAIKMASLYPANFLSTKTLHSTENTFPRRGLLQANAPADFVMLTNDLYVKETWINGEQVHFK